MNKETQILLGVGALALVGYLVWKNNQPKKKVHLLVKFLEIENAKTKIRHILYMTQMAIKLNKK